MKLILTTLGNVEDGDRPLITEVFECTSFNIWSDGEDAPNFWIELFGYPKCPKEQSTFSVGYDPIIDTITVVE